MVFRLDIRVKKCLNLDIRVKKIILSVKNHNLFIKFGFLKKG